MPCQLITPSVSGQRLMADDGEAKRNTENCPHVVIKASEEAADEAAKAPREATKPRYDWTQPSSSDGSARIVGNPIIHSGGSSGR